MADGRKLVKTGTPGIYRRQNADGTLGQYVVIYRAGGKQRREYADTLDAARRVKRERETDRDRGEWQERTTVTLRAYLAEWIDSYRGNGRRGFRDNTREEYRRLLDGYAHRFFGERLRLTDVTPRHLSQFVAWLADPSKHDGRELADATLRNAVMPVRAALATAVREGLLRHNPAAGLALPLRERIQEDDEGGEGEVKTLSRDQLAALLGMVPERYRVFVLLVASTGLRISEAIGLQRRHLALDGSEPHVKIRRAIVKGKIEAPKSKHGRRAVPLPASLVSELRKHLADVPDGPDALVFPSLAGTPLDPDNIRARVLKPIMEEVGAPWAGWHALRHTFASLQIAQGANVLQLSRMLGHHSAAFTLEVYCHLLEEDRAPALDVAALVRVNSRVNEHHGEAAVKLASECITLQAERTL
jgi:integrase